MSGGEGFPPLDGDPGGGTSTDGDKSIEANVFAKSGKMPRSPVSNQDALVNKVGSEGASDAQEEQFGLGLNLLFTPQASNGKKQAESQGTQTSRLSDVRKKVNELYKFCKEKHNVHHRIKGLVMSIKNGLLAVEQEQKVMIQRVEKAEKQLVEKNVMASEAKETPKSSCTGKRDRDTPGEEEASKKQKEDEDEERRENGEHSGWQIAQNKNKKNENKKKNEQKKEETTNEEQKTDTSRPRRERNKGDALIVEAADKVSYAALLRKVREDPKLKELGENVVKTRRTQRGEMLFELKKDPSIKSSDFKELVAKALGNEANVRALTQESVIECRDLDEITTADEVRNALTVLCKLQELPMTIRMRKTYGGTQTAVVRVATVAAKKLLEIGKVKVGWSVCALKAIPRVTKQMERCFKCMGFGHQARNCAGPDRSKLCRKCGEEGHFANDCANPAKCMLCTDQDGNGHVTGGFKCPAYKKAMANQQ